MGALELFHIDKTVEWELEFLGEPFPVAGDGDGVISHIQGKVQSVVAAGGITASSGGDDTSYLQIAWL